MKKILIVEDDKDIARALMIRLKHAHYQVFVAHDAAQGVSEAAKHEPDLAILDISMPAGDGFSVAERITCLPNVVDMPIIFITASKQPEYEKQAMDFGAIAYFEKPYDPAQLMRTIDATLQNH